jgi:hypothetical protein
MMIIRNLFLLLVISIPVFSETKIDKFIGTATDLKTGKLIYTEEHEARYIDEVNVSSIITYRDEKKNVIGKKEITFNSSSPQVKFRREDYRFGTVESAEPVATGIRLSKKEDFESDEKEKTITVTSPAAIDAGLNILVRNSWNELEQGKKVMFNLAVPSQLDYFEFRIVKDREELVQNKKTMVVKFESDHWYIRLFVDPVIVWYDVETKRALRYEGISNIYTEEGKSYVVRVTFDKPGP